jgi:hypothetical protein
MIARRVLAMRPTSVDPERNFSDAGVLISAKRSRFSPAKVEIALFVKTNYDLVGNLQDVPVLANPRANVPTVFSADFHDEISEPESESSQHSCTSSSICDYDSDDGSEM